MSQHRVDRVREERDFLLDRLHAEQRFDSTIVGRSSSAMVIAAMTGTDPKSEPFDVYDLNRCERTYERAPEHLRAAMWPILLRFRAKVATYHAAWHVNEMAEEHRPAAGPDRRDAA